MACCVFERVVIIGNPPRGNYIFPPSLLSTQQMWKVLSCYERVLSREKTRYLSGTKIDILWRRMFIRVNIYLKRLDVMWINPIRNI